jgi:septum formation protein
LHSLGVEFEVQTADVDETPLADECPGSTVERLSRLKAATVAVAHPGSVVLAADTVVVLDDKILGKPSDTGEARTMLVALRGRTHLVHTAVTVGCDGRFLTETSTSRVTMRAYSPQQLDVYLATGDPLDKAGAYAIQHPEFAPVKRWEGCYTSIMGLPLGLTERLLNAAGLTTSRHAALVCRALIGDGCCLDAHR